MFSGRMTPRNKDSGLPVRSGRATQNPCGGVAALDSEYLYSALA